MPNKPSSDQDHLFTARTAVIAIATVILFALVMTVGTHVYDWYLNAQTLVSTTATH